MTTIGPTDNAQAKFDAAPAGDTVQFTGAVTIGTTVRLRKPVTITGAAGHTLKSARGIYAFSVEANNVTITGLAFDGNLVKMFIRDLHPDGLVITKNKLIGRVGALGPMGQQDGAVIAWGTGNRESNAAPTNCKITHNVFDPIESWAAIYGCGWQNVEIAHNEFRNRYTPSNPKMMGRFLKFFGQGADDPSFVYGGDNRSRLWPKELWVHHNYFGNCRGFGYEKQDGGVGDICEDNYFEKTNPSGTFPNDFDNWAFSIVSGSAVDEIIRRNYLDCRLPAGITNLSCFRVAIEGGGCRQKVYDNYIMLSGTARTPDTGNSSIAMNGGNGSGEVFHNRIVPADAQGKFSEPYNSHGNTAVRTNNGPNVDLNDPSLPADRRWDINRPKPSAGMTPGPVDPPAQTIAVAATPAPDGSLSLSWVTTAAGPYTLSAKTSDGPDLVKKIGDTLDRAAVLIDGHTGWEYSITVTSGIATGTVKVRVTGGSSTAVNDLKIKPGTPPPTDEIARLKAELVTMTAARDALIASGTAKDSEIAKLKADVARLQAKIDAAKAALN